MELIKDEPKGADVGVVGADEGLLDEKVTLLFLSNDDEWERGAGGV
jgi:hypothetical protein